MQNDSNIKLLNRKLELIKIAHQVRVLIERGNEKHKLYPPSLNQCCLTASVMLFDNLVSAGFRPILVSSRTHMFVVCDGYLIDITATQFGFENVVIKDYDIVKKNIKERLILAEWWDEVASFASVEEASLTNLRSEYQLLEKAGHV